MLTLGIDDAGRGPLIGPMILSGVLLNDKQEKELKKSKIADSKTLYHNTRISLSKLIKENSISFKTIKTPATEIDSSLASGTNLNTLEANKTGEYQMPTTTKKDRIKVIIDCPSVNINAWKNTLMKFVTNSSNLTVICEHKADINHLSVSAASIIAKVAREDEVSELKKQYGDFGSGYPSDPKTKEFLKKHGLSMENSGIFRKSWSTWKKLFPDKKQATLQGF